MNKGIVALIIVLGLCMLCTLCGIGSYFLFQEAYKTPENLSVEYIINEEELVVGENSTITVKFNNTGSSDITIASIEFPYSVTEAIEVKKSNPEYKSADFIELGDWKYLDYVYEGLTIPANSEKELIFDISVKNSGYYSGEFTVYTDRMYNQIESFVSFYISDSYTLD